MKYGDIYKKLLFSRVGLAALIGFVLFCFHNPIFALIGFSLIFTSFDIFGYRENRIKDQYPQVQEVYHLAVYRILQNIFMIFGLITLYMRFGIYSPLGFLIILFFLGTDVLYYLVDNDKLAPFNWFTISPVVFFYTKILNKPSAPVIAVVISAIFGFALGLFLHPILHYLKFV